MPALIAITEDVGAREEKCAACGAVIGVVDFFVRCGANFRQQTISVECVHLDCDPDVKQLVSEMRAARSGATTGERKPS